VLAVYLCSGSLTSLESKLLLSVTVPVRPAVFSALTACSLGLRCRPLPDAHHISTVTASGTRVQQSPAAAVSRGERCRGVVADGASAVQVVLMYFMMQTSGGDHPPTWKTVAIQCVASGAAVLGACIYRQQMSGRPLARLPTPCARTLKGCCADVVLVCSAGVLGFTLNHLVC
jgi:hypothetical protein